MCKSFNPDGGVHTPLLQSPRQYGLALLQSMPHQCRAPAAMSWILVPKRTEPLVVMVGSAPQQRTLPLNKSPQVKVSPAVSAWYPVVEDVTNFPVPAVSLPLHTAV